MDQLRPALIRSHITNAKVIYKPFQPIKVYQCVEG